MGNLRSVQKAFEHLGGTRAVVVSDPNEITGCEKLILPGVGNFADGMAHLHDRGFTQPVHDFIDSGRPLMGICMGMQLLLDSSTEDAEDDPVPGLGVVKGTVLRFQEGQGPDQPRLKVPQMGWNRLDVCGDSPLFAGLDDEAYVYFVHGYYCVPEDDAVVAATADYGAPFCAALHRDNVWATQFHPEKSQRVGLQILKNFSAM
ncbi:glutamine amidotransferase [Algisphaera agarilytica]|uniref:Imidazole glycerol phosphate synthase subunit HisH n=2 Tax=Algisphaera agarilytica TaxID=1385975 RepID=A0A7X0LIZ8_9BACT|nr:glutamine amidotransferase [Algisphaera agarilytica]